MMLKAFLLCMLVCFFNGLNVCVFAISINRNCQLESRRYICASVTKFPSRQDIPGNTSVVELTSSTLIGHQRIDLPASVSDVVIKKSMLGKIGNLTFYQRLKVLRIEKSTIIDMRELPENVEELRIYSSDIKSVIGHESPNYVLDVLSISDSNITNSKIKPGALDNLFDLINLILDNNKLNSVPVFNSPHKKLRKLDLRNNSIEKVDSESFKKIPVLYDLNLSYNKIKILPNNLFPVNSSLSILDLSHNPITSIEPSAFKGLRCLTTLYLDSINIEYLPTDGLKTVKVLYLDGVKRLNRIPPGLDSIEVVKLAEGKSHLCCQVINDKFEAFQRPKTYDNEHEKTCNGLSFDTDIVENSNFSFKIVSETSENIHDPKSSRKKEIFVPVNCTPEKTPFQPCEDIMGSKGLTAASFIISLLALCGNFVVLLVFAFLPRNYNVSRFLVTNLAIADMSLAAYLFALVVESIITSGKYYLYVEKLQYSWNCDVLGALAILSNQLSVFSLTMITVERYLTVVYAMYPRYRLSMRTAFVCMTFVWLLALTLAILPVVGIGSYRKVAICLPFDTENGGGYYLSTLIVLNGSCFLFICTLYALMYRSVFVTNNSTPTRRQDSKVARRMFVLVVTDFACYAPIAVASIAALLGHTLIDVEQSKILLVFFFPLNGLLNPFLYAIITKAFRRDLTSILEMCFRCGGYLKSHVANLPSRSVHSSEDVLSNKSARPSNVDLVALNGTDVPGSVDNPVSVSVSKSEPNLAKIVSKDAVHTL